MVHHVLLSIASNRYQKKNLSKARRCLEEILSDATYTAERWTTPVGGASRSDAYLNQLVRAATSLDATALNERLKAIEQSFGRTPQKRQMGIVPIDLDILSFDGHRQHLADWERSYVKLLLAELP